MRRFLLYVHTGRRAALRAMLTVLEELRRRGVRAVVVDEQVDEVLSLPEDEAPPPEDEPPPNPADPVLVARTGTTRSRFPCRS